MDASSVSPLLFDRMLLATILGALARISFVCGLILVGLGFWIRYGQRISARLRVLFHLQALPSSRANARGDAALHPNEIRFARLKESAAANLRIIATAKTSIDNIEAIQEALQAYEAERRYLEAWIVSRSDTRTERTIAWVWRRELSALPKQLPSKLKDALRTPDASWQYSNTAFRKNMQRYPKLRSLAVEYGS